VGYPETGDKLSLGDFKTVGMSAANGDIKWSRPGFFMCGGTLQFLSTAVTCDFSGTVTERKPLQFSGLGLSFQGLDPVSGQVVWSEPVADPEAVAEAVPQPFVDGHSSEPVFLVVRLRVPRPKGSRRRDRRRWGWTQTACSSGWRPRARGQYRSADTAP
jgi:hypothetical protein